MSNSQPLFTIILALLFSITVQAQSVASTPSGNSATPAGMHTNIVHRINASGNITIEQPAELTARTNRPLNGTEIKVNGFRVLVFNDNNPHNARSLAQNKRQQIETAFPQWQAYISFNSPYWQVMVGDFLRQSEAQSALLQIKEAFPALSGYIRVVPDQINISE